MKLDGMGTGTLAVREVNPEIVLGRIARAVLPSVEPAATKVGEFTLLPHQVEAVAFLRRAIRLTNGAFLADPVGTGKSVVALAVAREYDQVTIVAPAALRGMWKNALHRGRIAASFESLESFSRSQRPWVALEPLGRSLVVVDEAHNLRNLRSRRFLELSRLVWGRDTLLLSATPIHNRAQDLRAPLSLFLGSRAFSLEVNDVSRSVCRRVSSTPSHLPRVVTAHPVRLTHDPGTCEALLALPPPLPPADGGMAAALGTFVLLRQWASSEHALVAALERRLTTAVALQHELADGRFPDRATLKKFIVGSLTIQLELGFSPRDGAPAPPRALGVLTRHMEALRALRAQLLTRDLDRERTEILARTIAGVLPGRCVVFTHSRDTAQAMYRSLKHRFRCGLVSGRGSEIASGHIDADAILSSFAPNAAPAPRAQGLDVLIATDIASEGVNLHDAKAVIHLDLPWTAARLEQRVGRLARLGATHSEVLQLAFLPPHDAQRFTRVEQRLAAKAGLSRKHVGPAILPSALSNANDSRTLATPGALAVRERLHDLVRSWRALPDAASSEEECVAVASAWSPHNHIAYVAVVDVQGEPRVVVGSDLGASEDLILLEVALGGLRPAGAAGSPSDPRALQRAHGQLRRWCTREDARATHFAPNLGSSHRRALAMIARLASTGHRGVRLRDHERTAAHRELIIAQRGAASERFLGDWCDAAGAAPHTADPLWSLREVLGPRARVAAVTVPARIVCILLLRHS